MRTTLDIDDPILRDLKALQAREGKSLGRLVSDLLVQALAAPGGAPTDTREFRWISRSMGARVDLADRDAVLDAMDERTP
jgi:hypothetical protein